jgi:hypothetical protein
MACIRTRLLCTRSCRMGVAIQCEAILYNSCVHWFMNRAVNCCVFGIQHDIILCAYSLMKSVWKDSGDYILRKANAALEIELCQIIYKFVIGFSLTNMQRDSRSILHDGGSCIPGACLVYLSCKPGTCLVYLERKDFIQIFVITVPSCVGNCAPVRKHGSFHCALNQSGVSQVMCQRCSPSHARAVALLLPHCLTCFFFFVLALRRHVPYYCCRQLTHG